MEIRVLRYFLTLAREETISGAANALHLTQPTLSRQLMELEENLGKKLFVRGNRGITLTDEGVLLRKRAEEIISLVDKTEAEFNTPEEIIGGDIYIGGGETEAIRLIAKCAKSFSADYPNMRYHLYSGNADDISERLDKGLLDFGIFIGPAAMKKYNYLPLPAEDTWGVLMRKESPLAEKDYLCPEDLLDIPLLCSRQTLVKNEISQWLGAEYEKLNIVATYNLIYNASIMVEEGIGYALCLDKLVNTTGDSNLCFRPLNPSLHVKLNVVWKKYQVFSRAAGKFLEYIEAAYLKN